MHNLVDTKPEAPAFEIPLILSEEQERAKAAVLAMREGGCAFVTGRAGTGKSTVLNRIRESCRCAVLAPTGLGAVNVRGQTIHSFFGYKPGMTKSPPLPERTRAALPYIDLIAIDEVSMVRADLLDMVDQSLRRAAGVERPFGGKPLVCFGDVWQLEPVTKTSAEQEYLREQYRSPFFFDSRVWNEADAFEVELSHIFRQQGDPLFRDALNEIREGGTESLPIFNQRVSDHDGTALRLTLTNERAAAINGERLSRLEGEEHVYYGQIAGHFGKELPTDEVLRLKEGARVMCLVNNREAGYVNGDLGTVDMCGTDYVVVQLDRGDAVAIETHAWEKLAYSYHGQELSAEVTATFEQIPLKLAWAVTVHKAQGQTFDTAHCEFERQAFAHGQTYVALSRCRTLAGMTLGRQLVDADVICRERVREWQREGWA